MRKLFALLWLGAWMLSSLGCAMCQKCGDFDYSLYGGSRPRGDRVYGRVGSAFEDAEGMVAEEEQVLDGEVIDDGGVLPEEELLPTPADTDEAAMEPEPAELAPEPAAEAEAAPDLPPGASSTKLRRRVKPDNYLP